MKHIWMIVAIMCILAAIHRTYISGFRESYLFFIFAAVSLLMYLLRNYMSKQDKNL